MNDNHLNYFKMENKDNLNDEIINKTISDSIQNNLIERQKIRINSIFLV